MPGTSIVIEKGVYVEIPVLGVHHDPEYYPNPDQFDPDRFDSEKAKYRNPMTWLPFGEGPRQCIGLRFGMMEARVGLVTLLNNFDISLGSQTPVPLQTDPKKFISTPTSNVYLKLSAIK